MTEHGTETLRGTAPDSSSREVASLEDGDRVAIIGGGPAGLTAAYQLAQRDVDVTVFEATDMVGGIARTEQYKGYRFDIGGHRFFTKIDPVQEFWEELLGDDFLTVERLSRIYYDRTFFNYPLKPINALKGLGVLESVRVLLSYAWAQLKPKGDEDNFEEWVSRRFGQRLYEIFFKTYTEKVWGIPCTEIRAEWAAQRIKGLSLIKALLEAASVTKRSDKIKSLIHEFQYPRLGPGQLWEITRDEVESMGGEVLMEHRVTTVEVEDDEAVAVRVEGPDGTHRYEADHVISSMPVRSLVRSLEPEPPAEKLEGAEGLAYRDFLVVALIIDDEELFPDNWIYVHEPGVKVGRVQNFKNWSEDLVPDPGRTCVGMEYFCFEGDGLWEADDGELLELATREIGELDLADPDDVVDGTVVRMPKAYPIYDHGYQECLGKARDVLDPIRNLHPVGRNGMHKYNNQDHSMLTAMMAVWNMEGASYDIWSVNTDFEYLEKLKLDEDRPDYQKKSVVDTNGPDRDGEGAQGLGGDDGAPADQRARTDRSGRRGHEKVSAGR
jgi:protoporphyrinogen oxidase